MRTAALALEHKARVLEVVAGEFVADAGDDVHALLDGVFSAFVAVLSHIDVDAEEVAGLTAQYRAEVLRGAAEALAEALLEHLPTAAGSDGASRALEVERSLARVAHALSSPVEAGSTALDATSFEAHSTEHHDPQHNDVDALVEQLREPAGRRPRALLRVTALTLAAADRLGGARAATRALDVDLPSASPDELIVTAAGTEESATLDLVRAGSAIASAVGPEHSGALRSAIVSVAEEFELAHALRAAAIRARSSRGDELLILDEDCFSAARDSLAEVPGSPRCIDPDGPFKNDRWELSAFLQRAPMLGREALVSELAGLLEARGPLESPRAIALEGAAGMGKTTVLRAALRERGWSDAPTAILWGAADPSDPTPLAAVAGMLRSLAGAPAGHKQASQRLAALVAHLGGHLHDTARRELVSLEPVLSYLLGAGDDPSRSVGAWSPRVLQVAIRRAALLVVEAMIARAEGRPGTIVVTGANDMDEPTIALLEYLSRRLRGKLVVVLVANQRLRLARRFEDHFLVERLEVPPLDDDTARSVVAALLGAAPEQLKMLRPIVTKARGSPLALAHVVRFAIEGGFLARHEGSWDPAGLKARQVPGRIEQLLERRVRRLPDEARRILGGCAMLGLTCTPAAVEAMGESLGLDASRIGATMSLLLSTGFLVHSLRRPALPSATDSEGGREPGGEGEPEEMYSFEHPALRPAALAALSAAEEKALHGHVARAHERVLGEGVRAVAASVGRHYRLAGQPREAIGHYATALRRAVRLDDVEGARRLAEEGLLLCDTDDDRLSFELELDKIHERVGDRAAQAEGLKALVRSAERTGDPRRQGQALHRVARFNVFGGDADKAEEAAGHALEFFRFDDDARGQAQCLRVLSLARFERRDFDGAVEALESARELTEDDDPRVLAVIDHQLGLMMLEAGDVPGALSHLLAARGRKRAAGDLAGEGAVLDALADVFFRARRQHIALELADRAVALRDRIGDEPGRAQSTRHLAEISLHLGDPWNATNLAIEARQLARGLSLGRLERSATLTAARAALQQGETETAEPLIDGVRRRVDASADPFSAMEAAVLSARAKWMRARTAEGGARDRLLSTALKRALEAQALGEQHGYASGQVLGTALAGAVYGAMGDASNALMHAQRASELVEERTRTRLPIEEVVGPYVQALLAIGDDDDARDALQRAVDELEHNAQRLPRHMRTRFWDVPARADLKIQLDKLTA